MIVPDIRMIEQKVFHATCEGCWKNGPDALDADDARELAIGEGWFVNGKHTLCEECRES